MQRIFPLLAVLLSLPSWAVFLPDPACATEGRAPDDVAGLTAALMGKHKRQVISIIGPPDRMVDFHMTPSGTTVGPGVETKNLYESGLWIYEKPAFLRKDGSGPAPDIRELRIWFDMNDKVMTVTRE